MSVPIFWAANGHELLRVEPSGDEAQFKKHIQEICNIPTGKQPQQPAGRLKGSSCYTAASHEVQLIHSNLRFPPSAAAMQRLERRDDGSYVLYVKLRGGCRRRVGAGLSCPCFGCQVGACSVQ